MKRYLIFLLLLGNLQSFGQKYRIKHTKITLPGKTEESVDVAPYQESFSVDTTAGRIIWDIQGSNQDVIFKITSRGLITDSQDYYYSCEVKNLSTEYVSEFYIVIDVTYKCIKMIKLGKVNQMARFLLYYE